MHIKRCMLNRSEYCIITRNYHIFPKTTGLLRVSINEFSEKQLFEILSKDYFLFIDAKNTYHKICKEKSIPAKDLKNVIIFDKNTSVSKAISQGEKLFLEKYKQISQTQKNLMAILV